MIWTVFRLTLRQFFGQRRSLLLLLFALIPVGLAAIYRAGDHVDQPDWTANVLMDGLIITTILPLACLILGTSALGSEIEDGTAVYLLAKPIPRRDIITAKFAASALSVAIFILPATAASGFIAMAGEPGDRIAIAFTAAAFAGIAAYTAIFILLSIAFGRALLFGLAYVFIWEGLVTQLFSGTRYLSIRQYCLGIAGLITTVSRLYFEADLGGVLGLVFVTGVTAAALVLAVRRLRAFELTGGD